MNIKAYLLEQKEKVDAQLNEIIKQDPPRLREQPWHQAMEYSLFSGGKRLRPILTLATAQAFSADTRVALPLGCVLELIHTYSLIHDDLPALDNDTIRRGNKTCHVVYGVPIATWAGFALLTKAYKTVWETARRYPTMKKQVWESSRIIFHNAGVDGMVGGQAADLYAEMKSMALEEVEYIHLNKTAALIEASILAGCNLYCDEPHTYKTFMSFGRDIGLAFQIIDDVLDLMSDTEVLGKNAQSDLEQGKATYPSVIGLENSKKKARHLIERSMDSLRSVDRPVEPLIAIAQYLYERKM